MAPTGVVDTARFHAAPAFIEGGMATTANHVPQPDANRPLCSRQVDVHEPPVNIARR
jgi:hypothetical protein